MNNNFSLQEKLSIINTPYKKTSAYRTYGSLKQKPNQGSCFWKTQIGYVVKYENAKITKGNNQ